jgi:hypothetical protein
MNCDDITTLNTVVPASCEKKLLIIEVILHIFK